MAPIRTLKGCTKKDWEQGLCGNFQGILFTKNGKEEKLFFRSAEERESYYKKHLQGHKEFSKFVRYSVCSAMRPSKKQRRCRPKYKTRKNK